MREARAILLVLALTGLILYGWGFRGDPDQPRDTVVPTGLTAVSLNPNNYDIYPVADSTMLCRRVPGDSTRVNCAILPDGTLVLIPKRRDF